MIFVLIVNSCRYKSQDNSQDICRKLILNCDVKENLVILRTSKGIIEVKLFEKSNPVTVANFISNIKENLYTNKNFYQIIKYPDNKIIFSGINQDSDFEKNNNKSFSSQNRIPLEIKINDKEPIYGKQILDPIKIKSLKNKFERGSLAMVKIDNISSSPTDFFIVLNKMPELDGRYSIFGKVIRGLETLEKINKNDFIEDIDFAY